MNKNKGLLLISSILSLAFYGNAIAHPAKYSLYHPSCKDYPWCGIYVSTGFNATRFHVETITGVSNTSTEPTVNETQKVKNKAGFNLAVGYDFSARTHYRFRVEARYTHSGPVDYNPNPVFSDGASPQLSMQSKLQSQTLMFNVYYSDVNEYKYFFPYIGAGIGISNNTVNGNSTLISTGATTHFDTSLYGVAWDVAIGLRFRVYKGLMGDIAFRHADIGDARWKPISSANSLKVSGIRTDGIVVALTYQIP